MAKKHLNGIHIDHHKNTRECATVVMPVPDEVAISLLQHIGAPAKPLVAVGDEVKVGQKIGETDAFVSAPIHASVSGKVKALEDYINPMGVRTQYIVIESDKQQTVSEEVQPPVVTDRQSFLDAIKRSGLVGLGGAGFPTFIKLAPKNLDEVDTLVINAAECEPYITADFRDLMENSERILKGIEAVVKYLELKSVKIAIEDNKPEAIRLMSDLVKGKAGYEVITLRSQYPQGAEKVIIYETTGRVVGEGQLPADVGVIVMNVSSVAFVGSYLETGMPLITKRLTVDGTAVKEPKNVLVPIGTRVADVIAFCGGYSQEPKVILMGGPMMGTALYDDTYAILKNNNAILAFAETQTAQEKETACIRCGRCVRACPIDLMPAAIAKAYKMRNVEALTGLKVNLCMECGCCSYVCPAKIHLVQTNRLAKKLLREAAKK